MPDDDDDDYDGSNNKQNEIVALIQSNDTTVKQKDKYGRHLLHYMFQRKVSLLMVTTIYDTYKSAITAKDNGGCYPLHYACKYNNQSERVVMKLMDEFPQAIKEKDDDGCYPLHYACKYNKSDMVVLKLIKICPQAVCEKGSIEHFRMYPLWFACQYNRSEKIILQLISKFPQAVQTMGPYSRYPLHLACGHKNQSEKVLLRLISEFPKVAERIINGNYSCHSATFLNRTWQSHLPERVVLVLINLNLIAVKNEKINYPYQQHRLYPANIMYGHQSATILNVVNELLTLSDYDLQNRIGLPKIITIHGLDNLQRLDTLQWIQDYSPNHRD